MKLARSEERGVEILSLSGGIVEHEVQVLSAGIGKLIRGGKSRIILELMEPLVPEGFIREVISLEKIAREHTGKLVVMIPNPELRRKFETYARPMPVESFADRASALTGMEKPAGDTKSGAADSPQKEFRADVRQRELTELAPLREMVSRLENENRALLEQLQANFIERRAPPDERAYQQRIQDLELKLEELMDEIGGDRRR